MSDEELIVTIDHLYSVPTWTTRVGYCGQKSREFFRAQGWDWLAFVSEGIPAQQLLDTGNALAAHLVEHARKMEAEHGQQK